MEATIRKLVEGLKSPKQVIKSLEKHNIRFEDHTEEKGYFDLKVWTSEKDCIRIYKPFNRNGFTVQKMVRVKFEYSGTPVFEPSGTRSF